MRADPLRTSYPRLAGADRSRLVLLAQARGDAAERLRLMRSCPRVAMLELDPEFTSHAERTVALVNAAALAVAPCLGALGALELALEALRSPGEAPARRRGRGGASPEPGSARELLELARRTVLRSVKATLEAFHTACADGPGVPAEAALEVHAPELAGALTALRPELEPLQADPAEVHQAHHRLMATWGPPEG